VRTKGATEVLDYVEDYSTDMAATSPIDTIATSAWAVTNGLVIGNGASPLTTHSHTDNTATVWLSGGVAYSYAEVTNTIVTAAGRTIVRTITFDIRPQPSE
jgi:hypothetical protein